MPTRSVDPALLERAATTLGPQRLWRRYRPVLLYGVIGCSGILLDLLLFLLLYNVVGIHPQIANLLSLTAGITNNFLLNSQLNFRTRDFLARRYARFLTVGTAGMAMVGVALLIFAGLGGADPNVVKVCLVPAVAAFQYWANSRWSFRKTDGG